MEGAINSGDTAWLLVSCALVLMMTPALALFYGGMVRRKNLLSTLTLSYIFMALAGVQWVLYGYSLAFGTDIGGLIGGLNFLGFNGVGALPNPDYAKTIPHGLFAAFQMMFAVITPALITGAFVERVRFKSFLLFSLIWMTLVYDPLAHWVWGKGGWLSALGVLDFAGGTVVHIAAGYSALAFAMVIGPRKGFGKIPMEPHNIAYTVLGAGLLWVGWFGFNAGSALAANGVAVNALLTTNTSAATAGLVWMVLGWLDGRPSTLGIATGMVVGLAAVTPAAGFVSPLAAMVIGGGGRGHLLLCHPLPPEPQPGRVHGRLGLPRHGQHLGHDRHRAVCHGGSQQRRRQRPVLRQPQATGAPVPGRWWSPLSSPSWSPTWWPRCWI